MLLPAVIVCGISDHAFQVGLCSKAANDKAAAEKKAPVNNKTAMEEIEKKEEVDEAIVASTSVEAGTATAQEPVLEDAKND